MKTRCIISAIGYLPRVLLLALVLISFAQAFRATADPLPRRILAFYDGDIESPDDCRIRLWAEQPLNFLGYVVEYRDVRAALPQSDQLRGVAAVLTWFNAPIKSAKTYLRWASNVSQGQIKIIVLGETGGRFWTDDLPLINELLGRIGIHHTGRYVDITFDTLVAKGPPRFEATLDPVVPPYPVITRSGNDVSVLEELRIPAREGGGSSIVAAIGSRGGFVASSYEMLTEPRLGLARWLIDPYTFFHSTLDGQEWPRPDVTTDSGRRVFLALAEVGDPGEAARDGQLPPLTVVLSEMVKRHPNVPLTISFDPQDYLGKDVSTAPRRADLERLLGLRQIEGAIRPQFCPPGVTLVKASKACIFLDSSTKYSDVLNFSHLDVGAARIGLLQVPSKSPAEVATRAATQMGLEPIEIFSSHYSTKFPSVAYVAPLERGDPTAPIALLPAVNRPTQDIDDFIESASTIIGTEQPRRISIALLYFQLSALADPDMRDWVESKLQAFEATDLHMKTIREYVAAVADFAGCEITPVAPNTWSIVKHGGIQTFRVDLADAADVDLSRSQGVLGSRRVGPSLYVSIDPAREETLIVLSDRALSHSPVVGLQESGWSVSNMHRGQCGWTYVTSGFGRGDFIWRDVPGGRYDIRAVGEHSEIWIGSAQTDSLHNLSYSIPLTSDAQLRVTVSCRDNADSHLQ